MAKFAYNNAMNASTGHMSFKLNCDYHPRILYKKKVNSHSKSKSADELSVELRKLMIIYWENLYHAQEFQKRPTIKAFSLKAMPPVTKYG